MVDLSRGGFLRLVMRVPTEHGAGEVRLRRDYNRSHPSVSRASRRVWTVLVICGVSNGAEWTV